MTAKAPPIAIRAFGTFELVFDGRPVEQWKAGKARNLLQFLLLRHGRVVSRDALFEALWPDVPWSSGSSSLKVAAHMLRRILHAGQPGLRTDDSGPRLLLHTREHGYLLEAAGVSLDYETFTDLVDQAHAAQLRGDRGAASARYRQAVELYREDFLAGEHYDWAAVQREWLRSRLLCALACLVETDLLEGDHLGVINWCQRLLEAEPCHEEAFRALMLVHGHLGQLEQVGRWYRLCVSRLRTHLHIAPDLATRRLYRQAVGGGLTGQPCGLPGMTSRRPA
ncbi:winged helix-turn-helix domain-containing protein [Streptomyces tuirus]|uniref:Winged helix-turn-helix domain-containing protein n=1 Tax=Streptomyces tuirus TaxID=68278 RepID=A0A941FAQ8_9ACTN|nr:winged helix-turn-helix domain-containing protein [Streptomyces tuirus]